MKAITRTCIALASLIAGISGFNKATAQGIHFSQYYNAPMLLNPANTALMSDRDFRLGINYRDQWATIPVPYKTFSAYGDFQVVRNQDFTSWLGMGFALFTDKAGNGDLSLTKAEGFIAYHLSLSEVSMLSGGLSVGYAQRSLNFNKLTFGTQWDGFKFDIARLNGENNGIIKTNFVDVGAGVNYAYFPNELVYMKIGLGVSHVNQATETFYSSVSNQNIVANKLGMRPTANVDVRIRMREQFTLNPSIYYTTQKNSYELVAGSLGMFYVGGEKERPTQLIVGAFYRLNEAAIGVIGLEWANTKLMTSYDFTVSKLSAENKGNGAFELSLVYQGVYGNMGGRKTLNCPRF